MADKALPRICSVDNCDRPHMARDYCSMHYKRFMHNGTTADKPRPNLMPVCVGGKFGRLTAIAEVDACASEGKQKRWLCECTCGNKKVIRAYNLRRGLTRSCGCLRTETTVARSTLHGFARRGKIQTTWRIWVGLATRCGDPENPGYKYYGGRGIKVCDRWRESFQSFLDDMGVRPGKEYSLDRIDNDGNYEPGNCRWATRREQSRNRRNAHIIKYRGKEMTLVEAADIAVVGYGTLQSRLKLGWSPERAIETHVNRR